MTTVGLVGGGQLARMIALAGVPLGLQFVFLDPSPDACAAGLGQHLCGGYDDRDKLAELARRADVVSYEFENVPEHSVAFLAEHVPVFPNAHSLATARDRLREKALFDELGIPTPRYAPIRSLDDLKRCASDIGFPAVLKTCTLGYDGKGQAVLRGPDDLDDAWARLGASSPLVFESFVDFSREVSIIGVRGKNGETAFYPLSENLHRGGILRVSQSRAGDPITALAQDYCRRLLDHLGYVGVLAVELFQVGDTLLANEMAPRVHNSGHWTIEGAEISQFENHLRAILGLALGKTDAIGRVAMVNFIGGTPDPADVLAVPGAHLHLYDKEPRPGRKVGHATLRADNGPDLEAGLERLVALAG